MKYFHAFPILEPRATCDLIPEAEAMFVDLAPEGYKFDRCEWHRGHGELLLICDVVPEIQWVRQGLIWRAAA